MSNQTQNQPAAHRAAALRVASLSYLKSARVVSTATAAIEPVQHVHASTFSTLVQDFIDECGYSDK